MLGPSAERTSSLLEKFEAKELGTFLYFPGIPDSLNLDGIVVLLKDCMKEAEAVLMKKGIFSFNNT